MRCAAHGEANGGCARGGVEVSNSMKDRDVLKLLLKNGWEEINVKGSHHKVKKGKDTLTVPVHGKDMDKGLLIAILKQAGLK